jgi:hypothetical protein
MAFATPGPGDIILEHAWCYRRGGAMAANAGPVRDLAVTEFDPVSVGWIALSPVGPMAR